MIYICNKCKCDRCKLNVNIYPFLNDDECKEVGDRSCFNCDDCYYYSRDNEEWKRNNKRECSKFQISQYYAEVEAMRKRKEFNIV